MSTTTAPLSSIASTFAQSLTQLAQVRKAFARVSDEAERALDSAVTINTRRITAVNAESDSWLRWMGR